ncbi:hypothetical protein [Corynebacterium uterequi]|uniref:Uncharacterized protein n=1 Tax=Corynebacterium uterequi TaxID=1072256 RepID=A0A0G3HD85_9CORY|nr:hypothetical protein [Corynebacterium uterequi]AKK10640.1 hypothetical protein CUTER_03155 [Corynebacterium uterequi]
MANVEKHSTSTNVDWPTNIPEGYHAVNEVLAPTVGASSPFGDDLQLPIPAEKLNYVHPYTRINR